MSDVVRIEVVLKDGRKLVHEVTASDTDLIPVVSVGLHAKTGDYRESITLWFELTDSCWRELPAPKPLPAQIVCAFCECEWAATIRYDICKYTVTGLPHRWVDAFEDGRVS